MKLKTMEFPTLINPHGQAYAIQIPIKKWDQMNKELETLKAKLEEMTGLRSALEEVQSVKKGKKKLPTLDSFLRER